MDHPTTTPTRQPAVTFLLILAGLAASAAAVFALRHTLSCFLLSFVLAYLFDPLVVLLEHRRVRRPYGIAILYLCLGVMAFFTVTFLVPFLTVRWQNLLRDLPLFLQKGKAIFLAWKMQLVFPIANQESQWFLETLSTGIDRLIAAFGAFLYASAGELAFNIFNLVLAPILILFMLIYKRRITDGITLWLPARHREPLLLLGREVNASIGGYIRGQLIVSLIVAILSSLALFTLGIDYPIFNGIFAGLASILPFIGVILATIPPLFFAYIKFQTGLALVKVIVVFSIIYFLEGYLIKPLVFKEAMDLNPLATIIAVMAFGELMGFWGILLAIPLTAAAKIVTIHLRHGDFAGEQR